MINKETEKRRGLARRVAEIYGANPRTRAAVVLGSTARDECDRFSDVDMTMFYETMPTDEELAERYNSTGGTGLKPLGERGDDGFAETFFLDGVDIQVGHTTIEAMEKLFTEVIEGNDTGHDPHVIVGGIQESVPLLGDEIIASWKERLVHYPDALAEAMVREHLRFRPRWLLDQRVAGRDTLIIFHTMLGNHVRNILGVLLGLNRLYPEHDYKRLGRLLTRMTIAPRDLDRRLRLIMHGSYGESTVELERLIVELFALVKEHMPGVETAEAWERFTEPEPEAIA